jgi:hypothetical protein
MFVFMRRLFRKDFSRFVGTSQDLLKHEKLRTSLREASGGLFNSARPCAVLAGTACFVWGTLSSIFIVQSRCQA